MGMDVVFGSVIRLMRMNQAYMWDGLFRLRLVESVQDLQLYENSNVQQIDETKSHVRESCE